MRKRAETLVDHGDSPGIVAGIGVGFSHLRVKAGGVMGAYGLRLRGRDLEVGDAL